MYQLILFQQAPSTVVYTWYRNDKNLTESQLNGFREFSNGTLKIQNTEYAAGSYRCLARDRIEFNIGAIISVKCVVIVACEYFSYNIIFAYSKIFYNCIYLYNFSIFTYK